jgi:hypothetical protein
MAVSSDSAGGPGAFRRFLDRWLLPYLPYPHFMATAPLDVVFRLLYRPFAWIPVAYWPRLALLIFFSTFATLFSLPERVVMAAWLRFRPVKIERHQAPVFVLGHSRSGTTFLQQLLAADPMLRSPRWAEVLAPQGFVVFWTVLRFVLIPFLPLTRMEEVIPLAPNLPGEDEFALNNWGVTSLLAGRAVLPRAQPFYDRFHDLDSLTPEELKRWRASERAFVEKLVLVARGRRPLLKSPGHLARVRYLRDLFPGAKFVHISRPPAKVFQSNLNLEYTLQTSFGLQAPLPAEEQEEIALREYITAEERYLADRGMIPAGDLAEVRLQDLSADPIGELKRVYAELGLPWSGVYERRLPVLLNEQSRRAPIQHPTMTPAQEARVAQLETLAKTFGHDRPAIPRVAPPPVVNEPREPWTAILRGLLVAAAYLAVWPFVDPWLGPFKGFLLWPLGVAVGYAVLGTATARSNAMGWVAAAITIAGGIVHLAQAIGGIDPGLLWRILDDVFTSDRVIALPGAAVIAFWIASGRGA